MMPANAITILLVSACISVHAEPIKAAYEQIVEGNNAFACSLYAQLRADKENIAFSPFSVMSILCMAGSGAAGNTAKEIGETLAVPLGTQSFHDAFRAHLDAQHRIAGDTLTVTRSAFVQTGYRLQSDYVTIITDDYRATLEPVDFARGAASVRDSINRHIEKQTGNRIRSFMRQAPNDTTRLIFVDIAHFKASWQYPFNPACTFKRLFIVDSKTTIPVDYMRQEKILRHAEDSLLQILELPYLGERFSMFILLPKTRTEQALFDLESAITPGRLDTWIHSLRQEVVQLYLPRFKIAYDASTLKDTLAKLGIRDAFACDRADFSRISAEDRLFIAQLHHRASITVDEQGTTATAVSLAEMPFMGAPRKFVADHPFLFLIRDTTNGCILFMGKVVNPAAAPQ